MHQIGVGVLGPVFRTYEPDGDRLVALKAFHLDLTPEQSRTLADLLQGIGNRGDVHPALVTPLDAGLSDDIPYLAAEYVAAESLDVAIRHYAPAPVDTALPLIVQLADAVDTAHACGLTHGALHLRDVFVTPELARMTGFGVVPALERVGLRGPLRRPYTAPEQMSNGSWGPAADRFALAAIVYELLTGRRAAGTGDQLTERLTCVVGARGAERLARLFASALAVVPTDRPASARLFADQLADAVGWTGAEAVREALAAMALRETDDRPSAGQPASGSSVGDGMAEGTAEDNRGREAPPAGASVTEVEGAGMANSDRPEETDQSELDWSERSLDRGEADEVREPAAYTPRPIGPPPGFDRPSELKRGVPTGYPQEVVDLDQPLEQVLDQAQDPAATRSRNEGLDQTLGQGREVIDSRPRAAGGPDESWDLTLSAAPAPDDAAPQPGELGVSSGAGGAAASGSPSPRGPIASDARGSYDGEDDDYQVVEPESPDSQAAGAYEPISLSDLSDRLGDGQGAGDDLDDEMDDDEDEEGYKDSLDAGFAAAVGLGDQLDDDAVVARGRAGSAVETPAAVALPLGIDENYDYDDEPDDGPEDDEYEESAATAWPQASRRLPVGPLVLLVLAVIGGAFAIGFGWFSGGASGDANSVDESLAAGLESPATTGTPVAPEGTTEREYSEGTIANASPLAAIPPTEPAAPPPDVTTAAPPTAAPAEPEPPTPVAAVAEPTPVPTPAPASPPARTAAVAPVASGGRLLVRSTPPGAQVAVNGEPRGTTPLALSDLRYDAYDVTFTFEGYETQNRRVTISADDPIGALDTRLARIPVPETAPVGVGSIFVDTRPPGAEVWLDQRLVGETPMLIPDVATGSHNVEFKSGGYRDWATTVDVGSAARARVTASLDPAR